MHFVHALGLNQYAIVQFVLFILIFAFLTTMVFGPFFRASVERQRRTVGGELVAEEFHQKTADLNTEYQNKARLVNAQLHDIFQQARDSAGVETESLLRKAREAANELLEKNRFEITRALGAATAELKSQTLPMSLAITNKLLGK